MNIGKKRRRRFEREEEGRPIQARSLSMPFFKSSPKGPQELVKALKDAMQILCSEEGGKKSDKVRASCRDGVRSIQLASPGDGVQTR